MTRYAFEQKMRQAVTVNGNEPEFIDDAGAAQVAGHVIERLQVLLRGDKELREFVAQGTLLTDEGREDLWVGYRVLAQPIRFGEELWCVVGRLEDIDGTRFVLVECEDEVWHHVWQSDEGMFDAAGLPDMAAILFDTLIDMAGRVVEEGGPR